MTSLLFHCTLLFQLFCILPNFSLHRVALLVGLANDCLLPRAQHEPRGHVSVISSSHIPLHVLSQLCYHDCRVGGEWCVHARRGGTLLGFALEKKKRKSEVLRMDDFTNTKDGCRCRQPWETAWENYRGAVWLTAFEKCIALASSSLSPPSKLLLL